MDRVPTFSRPPIYLPSADLVPVKLTSNLDAGGTATGTLYTWSQSGSGSFVVDPVHTDPITVEDFLGQCWGIETEFLWVKPVKVVTGGRAWMAMSCGGSYHYGTLVDSLGVGGVATVAIYPDGGGAPTVEAWSMFMVIGSDPIASGSIVGVTYDVAHARWVVVNATCN